MGKLAVHLLNCQLENEGRDTYECSKGMVSRCEASLVLMIWNGRRSITKASKRPDSEVYKDLKVFIIFLGESPKHLPIDALPSRF